MENEEYLAHYGVLGMRWGVRHDPRRAYRKATKKADKLNKKAAERRQKAEKAQNKARSSSYGITDTGRTIWENRQIKAGKATRKADKATRKAEKWIRKMDTVFADIPLSELEDQK